MLKFNFRKIVVTTTILLLMTITITGCSNNNKGLVAKVNGEKITEEEFNSDFQVFKKLYERQLGEEALTQVGEDGKTLEQAIQESIVEKLIMEKLVAKETDKMNITVTDEELKDEMEQYITNMGGKEKFEEFLTNNEITEEFLKENLRKDLLVSKHKEAFLNKTEVTEDEAKKYFEDNKEDLTVVRISHILVQTEEDGKEVLKRLKSGEDFASVAAQLSIDTVSAERGGELGYFAKGSMPEGFQETAFSLKKGETSDLVKTELGYHVIYLQDRKDTYDSLKEDVIGLLKEDSYLTMAQELRDKANVEIYLDSSNK